MIYGVFDFFTLEMYHISQSYTLNKFFVAFKFIKVSLRTIKFYIVTEKAEKP
jgi:hypothetical protein